MQIEIRLFPFPERSYYNGNNNNNNNRISSSNNNNLSRYYQSQVNPFSQPLIESLSSRPIVDSLYKVSSLLKGMVVLRPIL